MRMQLDFKSAAKFCAVVISGCLIVYSLVRFPLQGLNLVLLLCLFAGLVPDAFMGKVFSMRYLGACAMLTGAGGLIWLAGSYIEPALGNPRYLNVDVRTALFSASCFTVYLAVGWLIAFRPWRKGPN